MTNKIIVLTTCGSEQEAEILARRLIDSRLAACVNVIMQIRSFYRWQGKVADAHEWLLIIKTSRDQFEPLRVVLKGAHSYALPEVLAIPVTAGSPTYLAWLDGELGVPEPVAEEG